MPWHGGDFVLLTPKDALTRDDTWINRGDLVRHFEAKSEAIPDAQLRAQVSNHFWWQLARKPDFSMCKRQNRRGNEPIDEYEPQAESEKQVAGLQEGK